MPDPEDDFAEAKAHLPELVKLAVTMNDLFSSTSTGWHIEADREGGQPNGAGEIEDSDYREWYSEEREDHHRYVFTFTGPWLAGARPEIVERTRIQREATAKAEAYQEERILRLAEEIRARREKETNASGN